MDTIDPNDLTTIPLQHVAVGSKAVVSQVVGHREEVRRLEEMGLRSGVGLAIVRAGSPCIVRVVGRELCLRCGDGLQVLVHVPQE
ncbi:MAG TPA: FeoA domain-containing protein [Pirellulaceae bacterium]